MDKYSELTVLTQGLDNSCTEDKDPLMFAADYEAANGLSINPILHRPFGDLPEPTLLEKSPAKSAQSLPAKFIQVHENSQPLKKTSIDASTSLNTFRNHSEITSTLVPAACSSAIENTADRSPVSGDILGSRPNAICPPTHCKKGNDYSHSILCPSMDAARSSSQANEDIEGLRVEIEGDSKVLHVVVCIIWQKGMLGGCIYDTDTMTMKLIQDIAENDDYLSTKQLLTQIQPNVIVTGARQDGRFIAVLKSYGKDESKLVLLKNAELGYEVSRRRLQVVCESTIDKKDVDKEIFISSVVSLSHINMVRSSGGVIRYMELNSANLFINEIASVDQLPVLSVQLYFMHSQVWIDAITLSSLRVIHIADHPSTTLGNFYTREGFSLLGLMDRCKTSIGKKKLKEWFLRPSRDKALLNERLDGLEFFSLGRNLDVTQHLKTNMTKLRNMSRVVSRMKNAGLSAGDWLTLHKVLQSLVVITEICKQHQSDLPIFAKFPEHRDSVHAAAQLVFDILDVEQTRAEKTFTIKSNYDQEMDTLIQRQRDLPDILGERLADHVREVKLKARSSVHIHYSSQLGCLLIVDITPHMERRADYSIEDIKLEFIAEKQAYYSSEATREISEEFGDVRTAITDRSLALMYQLQNTLLPEMHSIIILLDLCAQLDCLISLSSFCTENHYVRPDLVEEPTLNVKASRHPLLEVQIDNYISNDVVVGTGDSVTKIMLLTGPNASGKSIYLKQVALVVYLAHIGSFVPADSAQIGLVDAIYAHLPVADSICSNVSTFTADLQKMSFILSNSTRKSLVILDEFGRGTCPVDGAALLLSIVKFWLSSPGRCPNLFLSTHFHTVARSEWLRSRPQVIFKMMDTYMEDGKVIHLYELVDGINKKSHAALLAHLLDIPYIHLEQVADQSFVGSSIKAPISSINARRKRVVDLFSSINLNDHDAVSNLLSQSLMTTH